MRSSTASKWAATCRPTRRRISRPRLGMAYDVRGDGRTIVRGGFGVYWNFSPGGTSSSKAQNPPFLQSTALTTTLGQTTLRVQDGLPPPPGVDPNRPSAGTTRSIFDVNFRDAYAQNWNINLQQAFGANYALELAYVGSRGRQMMLKGDPNQAPPGRRRDRPEPQPSVRHAVAGAAAASARRRASGTLDYHAPAREVPAPVREQLLGAELLHLRQVDRPQLGQRRRGHADQRLRSAVQPRAVRLRRDAHAQLERDLRAALRARQLVGRLADQRHPLPPLGPAADDHADAGRAVDGHRQPAEPHRRRPGGRPDDRRSGSTRRRSSRRRTSRAPTATPAATSCAGPGSSTSTSR